jgi:hypothetical protein
MSTFPQNEELLKNLLELIGKQRDVAEQLNLLISL